MEKIMCMNGEEIVEISNFDVEGYELIWTSDFRDTAGGGYDRVFYNMYDDLYLIYTNKNGYEGTWTDLTDVVEFLDEENPDLLYEEIDNIINNQK
jgi:hypothetical protein